ncbi:MAG: peptidoglycan DD-metalloendopeptidase family protein [Bacteroidia bacterium]|nr:peptidoglycan DD-metalloendopeptidase family protein [Bacteroidia bacterium]
MKSVKKHILPVFVLLLLFVGLSFLALIGVAQKSTSSLKKEKTSLESKKKYLAKEIEKAGKELNATAQKQKKTLKYIDQLSTKIQFREELVETYRSEVSILEQEISGNMKRKKTLEEQEAELMKLYGRMVYFAYKNRNSDDKFLYVLASDDMNEAFSRASYFKRLASFRRAQLAQIKGTQLALSTVIHTLDSNKQQKVNVLQAEEQQKTKLENEKQDQQKLAQQLKGKESEIRKKISRKETERQQLENKIQDIVRKLIEEERKKAEAAAKKKAAAAAAKPAGTGSSSSGTGSKPAASSSSSKPAAEVNMTVTPETRMKSASFEGNKGNMPWPVEKGAITGRFGVQPHPYLKNVTVKNDGVDITAPAGASARAIFDGEVSGIFAVDGYGKVVILRHGEYYTVYSNLSEVNVKKDTKVSAKQKIGAIMTAENGKSVINFQIRKGSVTLNPSLWLAY